MLLTSLDSPRAAALHQAPRRATAPTPPPSQSCASELLLLGLASLFAVAAAGAPGCIFGYLGWRLADHALLARPHHPDAPRIRAARALCMTATFAGAVVALALLSMAILGLTSPDFARV